MLVFKVLLASNIVDIPLKNYWNWTCLYIYHSEFSRVDWINVIELVLEASILASPRASFTGWRHSLCFTELGFQEALQCWDNWEDNPGRNPVFVLTLSMLFWFEALLLKRSSCSSQEDSSVPTIAFQHNSWWHYSWKNLLVQYRIQKTDMVLGYWEWISAALNYYQVQIFFLSNYAVLEESNFFIWITNHFPPKIAKIQNWFGTLFFILCQVLNHSETGA